jgi:hypothetical protein
MLRNVWYMRGDARYAEEAIREFSPQEKAELRDQLRKTYGLPAQPEPDFLWTN